MESATISFIPQDGPAANGEVASGNYSFTSEDGPVPGPQKVLVESIMKDKFKRNAPGRWELEYVVPEEGPFTHDFELNDAKKTDS